MTVRRLMLFPLCAVAMGMSACGDEADSLSNEQWLEQYAAYRNEWDRVARIFGFHDDLQGCEMIVNALAATQPKARYRCVEAER
jgi:hypothetical protein